MCHSVLEAALEERIPDELVWSHGIAKEGERYTSYQRISAAAAEGLLDARHRSMAHDLRLARNDTVHNAPQVSLDAESAVDSLAELLDALFPSDAPSVG